MSSDPMSRRLARLTLDNLDDAAARLPVLRVLGARPGPPAAGRRRRRGVRREGGLGLPGAAGVGLLRPGGVRRRRPGRLRALRAAGLRARAPTRSRRRRSARTPCCWPPRWSTPSTPAAGLGRVLMQTVVKDLVKRGGIRAVEAFGDTRAPAAAGRGRRPTATACCRRTTCCGSASRPTGRTRATRGCGWSCKSAVTWRDEVESALERLLGRRTPGAAPGRRPVATALSGSHDGPATPAPDTRQGRW